MSAAENQETIVAIATPPGKGGIGVLRISGPLVKTIAEAMVGELPPPRYAKLTNFINDAKQVIDQGVALYFPKPHSFTGEDVLELQGHGGTVVMDMLLQQIIALGARLAQPGEFSQRAFLNNKIDLIQAEAIADLIDAHSHQAAQAALRSLQGNFSKQIQALVAQIIQIRTQVEAAIDFSDEDIDFLSEQKTEKKIENLLLIIDEILKASKQGTLLREGMTVVIAGKPNAGKSSLLNRLSGEEIAIVTEHPGTTRDVLKEWIHIDGMPIKIIDTAGLRQTNDVIEVEGIKRAWQQMENANLILWVVDAQQDCEKTATEVSVEFLALQPGDVLSEKIINIPIYIVKNKKDLLTVKHPVAEKNEFYLSAKTGEGIEELKKFLKDFMGYKEGAEGVFLARRRQIACIEQAKKIIFSGLQHWQQYKASEFLAEDLRQTQQVINQITGEFNTEDLLGEIFATFCVGK